MFSRWSLAHVSPLSAMNTKYRLCWHLFALFAAGKKTICTNNLHIFEIYFYCGFHWGGKQLLFGVNIEVTEIKVNGINSGQQRQRNGNNLSVKCILTIIYAIFVLFVVLFHCAIFTHVSFHFSATFSLRDQQNISPTISIWFRNGLVSGCCKSRKVRKANIMLWNCGRVNSLNAWTAGNRGVLGVHMTK